MQEAGKSPPQLSVELAKAREPPLFQRHGVRSRYEYTATEAPGHKLQSAPMVELVPKRPAPIRPP